MKLSNLPRVSQLLQVRNNRARQLAELDSPRNKTPVCVQVHGHFERIETGDKGIVALVRAALASEFEAAEAELVSLGVELDEMPGAEAKL
jgi:hypothetical protein